MDRRKAIKKQGMRARLFVALLAVLAMAPEGVKAQESDF